MPAANNMQVLTKVKFSILPSYGICSCQRTKRAKDHSATLRFQAYVTYTLRRTWRKWLSSIYFLSLKERKRKSVQQQEYKKRMPRRTVVSWLKTLSEHVCQRKSGKPIFTTSFATSLIGSWLRLIFRSTLISATPRENAVGEIATVRCLIRCVTPATCNISTASNFRHLKAGAAPAPLTMFWILRRTGAANFFNSFNNNCSFSKSSSGGGNHSNSTQGNSSIPGSSISPISRCVPESTIN